MATKKSKVPALPAGATATPIQWDDPTELPLFAAAQLHVRAIQDKIYLTFGEVNLPVFDDAPPKGFVAHIRPRARIIVTVAELENMVRAMSKVADAARAQPGF